MAVIDLYTRRVLGPREIQERASYQPQDIDDSWSFADDMVDHDLAKLLTDPDKADPNSQKAKDNSAIERYAQWMTIGQQRRDTQDASFRPDHPHENPVTRPSSFRGKPVNHEPTPSVKAEREKMFRDIERARLTQTADDLRSAAQRLRDLAQNLRSTRDKLYAQNQRHDQDHR